MALRMALRWTMALAMALLAGVAAAQQASEFKSEKEKISYALGMNLARQLGAQSVEVDLDALSQGLKDALSRSKTLLTEQEVRAIMIGLQKEIKAKQAALQSEKVRVRKELGEKNKKDGDAFLAENKAREGVVTLESGAQYKILKTGQGKKPTIDDTVVCQYRGTLIDGTEFDSSYKRKQPATLPLKKLIRGWSEALQLMPVGSKWQLVIPSNLAYGERGVGRNIGPNATLIFEVELVSIKDAATPLATEGTGKGVPAVSVSPEGPTGTAVPGAPVIAVSFKMDPRLATGVYGGERWVSPPTYTRVGEGKTVTVETRVRGLDANGRPLAINPKWTSADPEMVTVTPGEGNDVKILVQRAGESSVRVSSQEVSRELRINAAYRNNVLQVEISQK